MNKISGVLRIHFKEIATWLYMPICIFIGNFIISSAYNLIRDEPTMKNSLVIIYGAMLAIGVITVGRTFYFAVGLSVPRRDYMIGTMTMLGIITLILSTFLTFASVMENYFSIDLGIMINQFVTLSNYHFAAKFYINFAILLHMFLLGMLIHLLIRKFGKHLIWAGGLLILGFTSLSPLEDLAIAFVKILWVLPPLALVSWSLLLSLIYGWISFIILRKLPV